MRLPLLERWRRGKLNTFLPKSILNDYFRSSISEVEKGFNKKNKKKIEQVEVGDKRQ